MTPDIGCLAISLHQVRVLMNSEGRSGRLPLIAAAKQGSKVLWHIKISGQTAWAPNFLICWYPCPGSAGPGSHFEILHPWVFRVSGRSWLGACACAHTCTSHVIAVLTQQPAHAHPRAPITAAFELSQFTLYRIPQEQLKQLWQANGLLSQ